MRDRLAVVLLLVGVPALIMLGLVLFALKRPPEPCWPPGPGCHEPPMGPKVSPLPTPTPSVPSFNPPKEMLAEVRRVLVDMDYGEDSK